MTEMEITSKHWFNVVSLAILLHIVAVMNINLTGLSAESLQPFSEYVVDLTSLAPAPVKPAPPPPPKPPPPEPKPEPKPKPPEPKVEPPKVVVPELEQPVPEEESPPEEVAPPEPAPPVSPPAASPKPGTQSKVDYGYYQMILDRLDRLKRYPARARRRGDQGTVILAFTLNRDGSLKHYEIRQSSGSKALDLEVKKLIRRAAPFPAIPANISQEQLDLSVPISFTLR